MLIIGDTGTGKSYLCKTIARVLNLPMVICNATQYTSTGFVGLDVEEMLVSLKSEADRRMGEWDGYGIVYLDETDKIASRVVGSSGLMRNMYGSGVQQEMLKLLENGMVRYGTKRSFGRDEYEFDVGKVMFFCGGAFDGLKEIIEKRIKIERKIGFGVEKHDTPVEGIKNGCDNVLRYVSPQDLIQYGFMPEFVGRLNVILVMDPLTEDDLVMIMTEPKNAICRQYKELLSASGIRLEITESVVRNIARDALKRGLGARGLRKVMSDILDPVVFENGNGHSKGTGSGVDIRITEEEMEIALGGAGV
ncbi:MAG: AAA family ATPase [Elusimicrobiota bacterium]